MKSSSSSTVSEFRSCHLIFVDESGCDKRVGQRRTNWSPLGMTPVQVSKFHRGQRYQILPAYTQDGILLSRIFKGSCFFYRPTLRISIPSKNFFAELKSYIRKAWSIYEKNSDQGFHVFLRRCFHDVAQNSRVPRAIPAMLVYL